MCEDINGYLLVDGLTTANAGMCRWGFAQKNGHEYFIKEFLSPKYPLDEGKLGPELTKKMRDSADSFFEKKREFYARLSRCRTGNIMIILDFFRHNAKYYAVTDKVEGDMLSVAHVAKLSEDQKYTLIKSILYSMAELHRIGIVHSDLRPENILIKATHSGYCTAKIIDFDAGFLETAIPDRIEGSQNYFSPEAILRTNGDSVLITTKADVWALGLLIHQYWCGKMPAFPEKYHYASEAILNGCPLVIDNSIPPDLAPLIGQMLARFPIDRPTAEDAWNYVIRQTASKSEPTSKPVPKSPTIPSGWSIPDDLD